MAGDSGPGLIQGFRITPREADTPGAARRRWRLLERSSVVEMGNYTLTKKGVARYDFADPYRLSAELSWPRFVALLLTVYVGFTSLFAVLYALVPGAVANARPYSFTDHFFFSLETLATVGYGYMYPASIYGHVISSFEIMTGVAFTAIMTGLIFFRFSKPRAKYLFARNPVITNHNGQPTLMLRIGNGQPSVMADAQIKISVLVSEVSTEGSRFRRTHELALARSFLPVFPLTWTVMHHIDERSPLYGLDRDSFIASEVRLFVSFQARDPSLASIVHAIKDYGPADVLFGMRYVDVIGLDENGITCADMTRLSDVVEGTD